MAIVAYLGKTVNEYSGNAGRHGHSGNAGRHEHSGNAKETIAKLALHCEKHPNEQLAFHSTYKRSIKETGEKITIHIMICHKCKKTSPSGRGCTIAVLPDFLYPHKHYSANEMETVKLQADEGIAIHDIETAASSYTVRRWLKELRKKAESWLSTLKIIAIERKCPVSEITLAELSPVEVLRTLIKTLPRIKSCGNILGVARMWVQTRSPP